MKQLALLIRELNHACEQHPELGLHWEICGGPFETLTIEFYYIKHQRDYHIRKALQLKELEQWDGNYWEWFLVPMIRKLLEKYHEQRELVPNTS